ncbi:CRM-domain containing factor CFM3 chloroplastic/mitochondrial-like [Prunus yedoensis var. nudiflora]|uniref:CRM-domain containing factor CFM3 chloroplastic/mitochondrial-like n=1 Tax=Prunus yedoensis var. nudiflora TaxID=2094558 RepID=A0A314ZAC5_PRUYE|nr:CRM-domain containing factor CFM3 chloroplastic/mitochondrial-like [Prunus yedoensis var. nudiflora]
MEANALRPKLILSLKTHNTVVHKAKILMGLLGILRLILKGAVKKEKSFERRFDMNRKLERERIGEIGIISIGVSKKEEKMISKGLNGVSLDETLSGDGENDEKVENFAYSGSGSIRLPWKRESELSSEEGDKTRKRRSNTELAERMLPDHELRRLRNVSLRMLERIKVGVTGITQALVNTIHEKWKIEKCQVEV